MEKSLILDLKLIKKVGIENTFFFYLLYKYTNKVMDKYIDINFEDFNFLGFRIEKLVNRITDLKNINLIDLKRVEGIYQYKINEEILQQMLLEDEETKKIKIKNKKDDYTEDFEKIWSTYPRKIDKAKAFKKFLTVKQEFSFDEIYNAVDNYKKEVIKNKTEEKFIKHLATFLHSCIEEFSKKEFFNYQESENIDVALKQIKNREYMYKSSGFVITYDFKKNDTEIHIDDIIKEVASKNKINFDILKKLYK